MYIPPKTRSVIPQIPVKTRILPPIFRHIAFCESGGKQFNANGTVIRGRVNSADTGKYQINMKVWADDLKRLGINPYTENGNEQAALHVYKVQGLNAWAASKHCWSKYL